MAYHREKSLEAAQRFVAKGQFDKAAQVYREVVTHEPSDLRIWLRLADVSLQANQKDQAVECFLRVGAAYEESEDPQKALAVYRQAASADPSRLELIYKCAELNMGLGRSAEAVEMFESVARAQVESGQTDQALALYLKVVEIEPRSVSRRLRLAELLSRLERTEDAVKVFRSACVLLLEAQDYAQYIRVAERLLYHQQVPEAARELVRVYLTVGQPRRALVKLNALLQKNHADYEALELLAETFLALDRPDKGLSVILELARSAKGQGLAAQEAASRAVLKGLDAMPDHPELIRVATELSDQISEGLGVDLSEDAQGEAMAQMGDDLEPEAQSSPTSGPQEDSAGISTLPQEVALALHEATVLLKYRLVDHAQRQLEPHLGAHGDHPEICSVQAAIFKAKGDEDGAFAHRLGVAQRLVAAQDHAGADKILQELVAERPHDPALGALQSQIPAFDSAFESDPAPAPAAEDRFEAAQTSNYSPVAPQAGGEFEIEFDAPEPAQPSPAAASPSESKPRPRSLSFDPQDQPSPAAASPSEPKSRPRSLSFDPQDQPSPAAAALSEPKPRPRSLSFDPQLDPPPSARRATSSFRPVLTPGQAPQAPAFTEEEPAPAAAKQQAQHEQAQDAQALGAWGVAKDAQSPSLPAQEQKAVFDDSGEDVIEIDDIHEIEDFEEIEEIDILDIEEVDDAPNAAKAPYSPGAAAVESMGEGPTNEEINELRFYLQEQLQDEAAELFADLRVRFGDRHPSLGPYFVHFGEAPPQQELLSSDIDGTSQERLVSEDEADMALSALAPSGVDAGLGAKAQVADFGPAPGVQASSSLYDDEDPKGSTDASLQSRYDLALAYRDMGLLPNAIGELQGCLRDPSFRFQAAMLLGEIERSRGELQASRSQLAQALSWAANQEQIQHAQYELALTFEELGELGEAQKLWSQLPASYRDVQQRLARTARSAT